MKRLISLFSLLITVFSVNFDFKAAVITAITDNGAWSSAASWDLNRAPVCGDTIVVPLGIDLNITQNVNLDDINPLCSAVKINIFGSIRFFNGRKMFLAPGACFTVESGGLIRQSPIGGGASEYIAIDNVKIWQASQGNLAGLASFGCPIILPVTFESMTLTQESNIISIEWSVSTENNLSHYELFASKDGMNWESIYIQQSAGNTSHHKSYNFRYTIEENMQTIYFKLKSVDLDGKEFNLALEALSLNASYILGDKDLTIFPNPATESSVVTILVNKQSAGDVELRFYDYAGKLISSSSLKAEKGNNQFALEINNLQKGSYFVSVNSDENNYKQKLVIR